MTGNLIDRARECIERHGWQQGSLGNYLENGPVCVMGALYAVIQPGALIDWRVLGAIRDEYDAPCEIPAWNDDPSTSLEDVLLVLKRASARLDEAAS